MRSSLSTIRRRRLLLSAALVSTLIAHSAARCSAEVESAWETVREGAFSVMYREGERRAAETILASAVERTPSILKACLLDDLGDVTVYIAATDAEFRELTSSGVPDWGVGCALPGRGLVVLKSPRIVSYPLQLEDVVVHEVGHIAVGRVLGDTPVPRWLHEGAAMTLAGEWRLPRSVALSVASALGHVPPLGALSGRFPEGHEEAMMAYSESFYAVRFLMERSGFESVGEMLQAIRSLGDFDAAVAAHYGADREQFERDVSNSFGRRFGWGVFLSKWNVMFVLLAIVFLVGGALRIRRGRARMREWEEGERGSGADLRQGESDRRRTWQ